MKLFVALVPPDEALTSLQGAVDEVAGSWPRLRWTSTEAWHITLCFLGHIDEAVVPAISGRLARVAARHGAVQLSVRGAGAFSRPAAARVVWAGVDGSREELRRLADSVSAAARHSGIEVEDRPFRAHLTLARSSESVDMRELVQVLSGYVGPTWTADELHLVRSHPGPRPRYETLSSWALQGRS